MNHKLNLVVVLSVLSTGCGAINSNGSSPSNNSGSNVKRIFATSSTSNGNLGGLAGADAICSTRATAAGLGGTWKAWLSSSTTNAIDRITDVGPWYRVDRTTKLFNDKANLTTTPLAPIGYDENGNFSGTQQAWTGTLSGGNKAANTCNDWTDGNGALGLWGNIWNNPTTNWTDGTGVGGGSFCSSLYSLYCVEQ